MPREQRRNAQAAQLFCGFVFDFIQENFTSVFYGSIRVAKPDTRNQPSENVGN